MRHSILVRLLPVVFLFGWGIEAFAQGSFTLGIRGGLNIANVSLSGPAMMETSSRTVFGFGGVAEFGLTDLVYLQVEPGYIQKGGQLNFMVFGQTYTTTGKFNYVDIPVSIKIRFDAGKVKPYLFVGPAVSFLLSAEGESEGPGLKQTQDIKGQSESTEWSLDFGVGLAHEITMNTFLTGDIRYSLGLSNVLRQNDPNGIGTWKSRDVKILVGILFSL